MSQRSPSGAGGPTGLRRVAPVRTSPRGWHERPRRVPVAIFSLIIALLMALLTAAPAVARPEDPPSQEEVEQSKEQVEERAAAVDRIEEKLANARGRMDELSAQVQRLVEKYYREQVELERARQQYRASRERLRQAEKRVRESRESVAALAAQRYRNGGLQRLGAVLASKNPQDVIDRMNSLQILSRERAATLDEMRATKVVAKVLREQSEKAFTKQQEATRQVEDAKKAAQRVAEQQRDEVERIQRLEAKLADKLDNAQARAQRLEQERKDYLQWRREQRAKRRAAREAAREAARQEASQAQDAARQAAEDAGDVTGNVSCADKPVSLSDYSNGLIPPQALCPLPQDGHMLRADAAAAFIELNAAYTRAFGEPICVTDSYRSLAVQQRLAQVKPELAAVPGTSNHGWGVAVDLCGGINSYGTDTHEWMRDHASAYGWVLPAWARADGSMPEPWHWEYTG